MFETVVWATDGSELADHAFEHVPESWYSASKSSARWQSFASLGAATA